MSRIGIESPSEVLVRALRAGAARANTSSTGNREPDFPTPAHIVEAAKRRAR